MCAPRMPQATVCALLPPSFFLFFLVSVLPSPPSTLPQSSVPPSNSSCHVRSSESHPLISACIAPSCVHSFDHNPATAAVCGTSTPALPDFLLTTQLSISPPSVFPRARHFVVFSEDVFGEVLCPVHWQGPSCVRNGRCFFCSFPVLQLCIKPFLDVPFSQLTTVRLSPKIFRVDSLLFALPPSLPVAVSSVPSHEPPAVSHFPAFFI